MEILAAAITLTVVVGVMASIIWYLRRIRAGRAAPYVNPAWPTIMRPSPTEFDVSHHDDKQASLYNDDSGSTQ